MSEPVLPRRRPPAVRLAGFAVLLGVVALGLDVFSAFPWVASAPDAAVVRIAFKRVSPFEAAGPPPPSPEELERRPAHMRPQSAERARTGRRSDTILRVVVDDRARLEKRYRPGGIRHDGPTFGYEEIPVTPGRHRLEVVLADAAGVTAPGAGAGLPRASAGQWHLDREVEIRAGRVLLVEFSDESGLTAR